MTLPPVFLRRYLLALSIMLALASLVSCGDDDRGEPTPTPEPVDSGQAVVPMKPDTGYVPGSGVSFEESLYRQYARLAVGLPRSEMDSILRSTPPTEIEQQMSLRLQAQDTIARGRLADKYNISRDSVDAILSARNVPKR